MDDIQIEETLNEGLYDLLLILMLEELEEEL